jgi:nucleotide-binding universal stress UspA family protein
VANETPETQGNETPGTQGFELGTDGPTAILVGMDDTDTASHAFAYAVGLARRQGARLIAVFVIPGASMAAATPAGAGVIAAEEEAFEQMAGELRGRVKQASEELGVNATFIVAHGDPYTEIKRMADEMRADAMVVGASAKAGHRIIGSLAVRLVRAGRWPVTVVP